MSEKIEQQLALAQQYARAGAYDAAQKALRKVIDKARTNVGAWLLLGQVCGLQNAHADAEQAFAQAARLNPRSLDAHAYLGLACMQQGKDEQAIAAFKAALDIQPRLVMALANLVALLHKLERQREALPYQERWLAAEPLSSSAHYSAAVLYQVLHQLQAARKHYEQALELGAGGISVYSAHLNLGVVCYGLRDFDAAIAHSRQALASKPDCAVSYYNIGNAQKEQGKHDEAIASFDQALKLDPGFADAHGNILFCMNYVEGYDAQQIFARHIEWAERHAARYIAAASHSNDRDPLRILRIGYVSADFREHPVGFFLEGVLQYHSAANCGIYCYFNSTQEDAITARLRAHVPNWRQISALDDDAVAAMVRSDGIDILVDLSGHTSGNRLLVFARKPAPVQVTWLGYCNTTGLSNMDYLLADAGVIPPDTAQRFSEQVLRLPGSYLCYVAPDYAPEVVAPPGVANGYVTFGCFNNLSKVTETMLVLWAEILRRMPDARFILKSKQLADPAVQQRYRDRFSAQGIAPERIILDSRYLDHAELLGYYGELDIALDTHPYSGVTTTCEALWMGVPVVTLAGEKFISRNSAALVSNAGLDDLIAGTPQQYVETAVALAADGARLAQLRSAQRERFKASPLGNAPLFVQNLEAAYREMWEKWCASAH
ncbi:MAG TPA: tetratricopeptide repeat protein [Gallionella sp.]